MPLITDGNRGEVLKSGAIKIVPVRFEAFSLCEMEAFSPVKHSDGVGFANASPAAFFTPPWDFPYRPAIPFACSNGYINILMVRDDCLLI